MLANTIAWDPVIKFPEEDRLEKPRTSGITMVIDKGLGLTATGTFWI